MRFNASKAWVVLAIALALIASSPPVEATPPEARVTS